MTIISIRRRAATSKVLVSGLVDKDIATSFDTIHQGCIIACSSGIESEIFFLLLRGLCSSLFVYSRRLVLLIAATGGDDGAEGCQFLPTTGLKVYFHFSTVWFSMLLFRDQLSLL